MTSEFETLSFFSGYRSGTHDIGEELFNHALLHSLEYRRAAGFFSSSVLSTLRSGLTSLFERGGTMTLVTGPVLSDEDMAAIRSVYIERSADHSSLSISALFDKLAGNRMTASQLMGELLRRRILRIYIARRADGNEHGVYHEKFALFSDSRSILAATGSGNESLMALKRNFERFETFRSWVDNEKPSVFRMQSQFLDLLKNQVAGLEVVPLATAYEKGWLKIRPGSINDETRSGGEIVVEPKAPEFIVPYPGDLFNHQKTAVSKWSAAGGRGTLAMATGSGKTITAYSIASRLFDATDRRGLIILVVAPLIHLVDQWIDVARSFGLRPIRCAEGSERWESGLSTAISAFNHAQRPVLSIAVTSTTLQSAAFQKLLKRIRGTLLVIGDECHNYGTRKLEQSLPDNAAFRLGLSATPVKWLDDDGTARIKKYFGDVVFEYSLGDAIKDGILVPYRYTPILAELESDEAETYREITRKLLRFGIDAQSDSLSEGAKSLLMKRARIISSARAKLPLFRTLIEAHRLQSHILVYCGDGQVNGEDDLMSAKQIDRVVEIISEAGLICAKYTAETPADERRELLRAFADGLIQVLVAIRCLDEGVDVPSTRVAIILSSSSNPRQFIQRRGRVLRRSDRTGKQQAEIYDFFVIPPLGEDLGTTEKNLVRRQLERVTDFSNLALNAISAKKSLMDWTRDHNILEVWAHDSKGKGDTTA